MEKNSEIFHLNQRVKGVVAEVMSVEEDSIQDTDDLRTELDIDSMDVVTIAALLSDELGFEVEIDDIPEGSITVTWITEQIQSQITRRADSE